jgi:DNA (cytosine-5)-methyltransferase 1
MKTKARQRSKIRRWLRDRKMRRSGNIPTLPIIEAVDLFCGAGGLSHGMLQAGIKVVAGYDLDPACEYPFQHNNRARYIKADIASVTGRDLDSLYSEGAIKVLAGCAPCQPFSTYRQGVAHTSDKRWNLLMEFARLVEELEPEIVTMENVPRLMKQDVFHRFIETLIRLEYKPAFQIVNCVDYGVPQLRKRLVLLASKRGEISLIPPTHSAEASLTVRAAIGDLPRLIAGGVDPDDPLHTASSLSETNLRRIRASRPGGTWRDWNRDLVAECHTKETGKSYPGVYARMSWDQPSPTMTTQFFGFGNGRFGHPEQDRGISLREGAILQSFPSNYSFAPKGDPLHRKTLGRLIGNAVPVQLGKAIGTSILAHISA